MLAGAVYLQTSGGFSTAGTGWRVVARYILGMIGVVLIWAGLDQVFPEGLEPLALFLRWLRYALVGVWVAALAPKVFIALGWASAAGPAGLGQPQPAPQ